MKCLAKTLLGALVAAFFTVSSAEAEGGQDFPFFVCSTQEETPRDFILGKSERSLTGFAVWLKDVDGTWRMFPIDVEEKDASYIAKGKMGVDSLWLEAQIPADCVGPCGSRFTFKDKAICDERAVTPTEERDAVDEINASCRKLDR